MYFAGIFQKQNFFWPRRFLVAGDFALEFFPPRDPSHRIPF